MRATHKQVVVHLVWRLSSFMRTFEDKNSHKLLAKITDFDSAHTMEDCLSEATVDRLRDTRSELAEREPWGAANIKNYDISLVSLLHQNVDDERLRSDDKKTLDARFSQLQREAALHLDQSSCDSKKRAGGFAGAI